MITDNLKIINNNIKAALKSSPFGQDVLLVAVSKTHSSEAILEAYNAGQRDFGENRPQELALKYDLLPKDINWHMIGHLQTNKVKKIIDKVCMIHSVDSLHLAEEIDKEAFKISIQMPVLIEVNIAGEKSKSGVCASDLPEFAARIALFKNIKVMGLMCIPPYAESGRESVKYFRMLRNLSIDIKDRNIDNISMNVLSMGMSGDYIEAISEGSTIVRVGTAIFGMRDYSNT